MNAMGAAIGAATRSKDRTHRAAATLVTTKTEPYAVAPPPYTSRSRQPAVNRTRVISSPQPRPVSRASGSRRTAVIREYGSGGGRRRCRTR
ncbi:hypothetical protein [Streptomyces sp. MST-110588]|uniref:hypothetical protein n=1 Tax=Streptomyces sp. MST-110588 TaxID=2833628 RepID=UPI001F5C76C6|nr:hypothetical protein [Streptomyces sp. MST-110588]UNO40136.1 hypothetical protein KGS77_11705 [Streptomyces sp. MST-110588]